jgi:phosphatidyl-myo-inositol dimannoside synthase
MRILALLTDGFGGFGGIAQYNRDLAAALASLKFVESIYILPRAGDASKLLNQVPLSDKLHQESPIPNRFLYSLRALRLVFTYKPDLIFCGHLNMAPLAWLLARLIRKPFWLQTHGLEAWDRPSIPTRFAVEGANFVTAVSRYTRRRFLAWSNVSPDKVRVLPNTFTPPPATTVTKDELKARYDLENRKIILTVSRLDIADRYKGHDKVLAVLPSLIRSHHSLVYVIVGDGDDRARVERVAQDLSLAPHVRFAGRVNSQALTDYYRMSDVYVMPSTREGFGIVFLEAAAFGLSVVGGNVDGSVDALGEGAIGATIDPMTARTLAHALKLALSSAPKDRGEVQRFSRSKFSDHVRLLSARIA